MMREFHAYMEYADIWHFHFQTYSENRGKE